MHVVHVAVAEEHSVAFLSIRCGEGEARNTKIPRHKHDHGANKNNHSITVICLNRVLTTFFKSNLTLSVSLIVQRCPSYRTLLSHIGSTSPRSTPRNLFRLQLETAYKLEQGPF